MMRRRWLLGVAATALFSAGIILAKPGIVVTRDGQRLEGEITEKNDQVSISIRGIETSVPRGNVLSITYAEPFEKEYQERLGKLDPKDVKGRIELARWAFDQKQYPAARDACDAALAIDPNNREAYDLARLIRSQVRLEQTKAAAPPQQPALPKTGAEKPAGSPAGPGASQKLLTPADINAIRQWELRPRDTRVNIRFENNVEKRYIQFANLQFSEFNSKSPVDRAIAILDNGDPSMRKDVKILSDPSSMIEYKSSIQPMIISGCATSNCHAAGSPAGRGGAFQLIAPASNDAATYTNFYILSKYHKKFSDPAGGVFEGNVDRKMIDRGHGTESILAQYMLPADVAKYDHPKVANYNGIVRNKEDPRWRLVVNWMDNSLGPIVPDYGIDFQVPSATSTQPAASQPTGPTRK